MKMISSIYVIVHKLLTTVLCGEKAFSLTNVFESEVSDYEKKNYVF